MAQNLSVGIRIYNALDAEGNMTNVLVGVDDHGNDLYECKLFDSGYKTPPGPLAPNPLNS